MASRHVLRLRTSVVAGVVGGAAAVYPIRNVYAETPLKEGLPDKKPIYSDHLPLIPKPTLSDTSPASKPAYRSPTPTDRLTIQVRKARLFVYDQSLAAENGINSLMSFILNKETSFTGTIASLAPAPETGEQLLPGAIYVLVATMAGSIITRNRGLFLRASFPLAIGITAGWMLIPVTMRNIAELSWEYERKVPFISNTHAEIGGFTKEAWRQTKVHAELVGDWADEKAATARERIESWVRDEK